MCPATTEPCGANGILILCGFVTLMRSILFTSWNEKITPADCAPWFEVHAGESAEGG